MSEDRFDWLEVGKAEPKPAPAVPEEQFDAPSYLRRARKAHLYGAYEAALRFYGRALREDNSLAEAWLGQVGCLQELGELNEARVWANKALEKFAEDARLLSAKAVVAARLGDMADALALCDRAMSKKDPPHLVWLHRGLVLLCAETDARHEGCFHKALESGPRDSFLSSRIGMGYLYHGDLVRAKIYLTQATDEDPENPLAWFQLGRCCERLYALDQAEAFYARALALHPEFKDKVTAALGQLAGRGFWSRLSSWWRGRPTGGS